MEKPIILVTFLAVVIVVLLGVLLWPVKIRTTTACFADDCFLVEVAITDAEQQRGLMFREYLDKDKGMLFIFDGEEIHSFWMKNTLIPLDIIWINQGQEIVFIAENTQPCHETCLPIDSKQKAKYVLEINGGLARELGLNVGEKVSFQ